MNTGRKLNKKSRSYEIFNLYVGSFANTKHNSIYIIFIFGIMKRDMLYRAFIRLENEPELWVMEIEGKEILSMAIAITEYMSNFGYDWKVVSMNEVNPILKMVYDDINLN